MLLSRLGVSGAKRVIKARSAKVFKGGRAVRPRVPPLHRTATSRGAGKNAVMSPKRH
jgi:hypothetical protein